MPNGTLEISNELNSEVIATYELKSGKICYICILNDTHIQQSLKLQQEILDDLGPAKSLYIVAKTAEEFSKLRDGTHGITLGAFVKDEEQYKLIGQQMLILHKGPPHHSPVGTLSFDGSNAEFSGDIVDPLYRGNNLSVKMKILLEEYAKEKNIDWITGEVHLGNLSNQSLFIKNGFFCAKAGYDPDDGAPLLYFFKPTKGEVKLAHEDKHKISGNDMTIKEVQELTKDGYYCGKCKYDSGTQKVTVSFYKHVIS